MPPVGTPHMFGHPHIFVCPHMFGCALCIHVTKKVCFVRLRGLPYAPIHLDAPVHKEHKESMLYQTKGVSICPIHLDAPYVWMPPCMSGCPHMFGHPLYVLMPPICLYAPHMF